MVHEAYVRLVDATEEQNWNSRGHFFGAAAEAMRRILVESARGKLHFKEGGRTFQSLDESVLYRELQQTRLTFIDRQSSTDWIALFVELL